MDSDKRKYRWLFAELLKESLTTGSSSVVREFLPILAHLERDELISYLFWQALRRGAWWLAEDCLNYGFSLVPPKAFRDSPLHSAMCFCGDRADIIAWMLDHGAELERRDLALGNSTPLIHAAGRQYNGALRILLERGANVDARTLVDDDVTALMVAACVGNLRAVELLLAFGADVHAKNRWGQDAPTLADAAGFPEVAALLRRGASRCKREHR